ncbi:peptidase S8/S53 domain-containing protein [Apodospora peruviana]|uniref:Peptidase S8/S53 domain-containing protein n=1 Tax=Apodospora peruviana TaxID=516989 RepID=A0AAE0IT20_9PEZI|nr:peptidase S8/S53 domain-containing protein [Apodospora peruviana]
MSDRRKFPGEATSRQPLSSTILYGCASGLLGAAVMTMGQKAEQQVTNRPNSYVPGRTLQRLSSGHAASANEEFAWNMAMHYGQGAVAGVIRAYMAWKGVRGPFADFMFIGIRLLIDQTLENYTGVGALPWTWPIEEQIIDIIHKTVYALATGYLIDKNAEVSSRYSYSFLSHTSEIGWRQRYNILVSVWKVWPQTEVAEKASVMIGWCRFQLSDGFVLSLTIMYLRLSVFRFNILSRPVSVRTRASAELNMVLYRSVWAILVALVFTTASNCHPTFSKVVHERRDAVHAEWTKIARANPDTPLTLRIGLKQQNLERAEEFMHAVAHPGSEQYGLFWTPQQVADMFAPSADAIAETEDWLQGEGVTMDRISKSSGRNWVRVKTTVGEAETLLDTTYNVYENGDGAKVVACEAYSVPATVQRHVDLITPTIQFDTNISGLRRRTVDRRDAITPKFKKLPPYRHHGHDDESLDNCSNITTPACLRALYDIPKNVKPAKGNSYGIVEFAPQSYNQTDLDGFFSIYTSGQAAVPNGTAPVYNPIDGGYLSDEPGITTRGESNLDLCYAIALTYPQNVTLYQVGDNYGSNPATNNNFLDAIDGSYCSFEGGDDYINGDANYPHDASWPGAYTGENQCGVWNATKVISVSYGRDEAIRPRSYTARECTEYMKLGLMGVTVLFSSGDRGVAGVTGRCLTPNGGLTPPWNSDPAIFNPVFPGTCPWVTAVGGTSLPVNGTIRSKEVVATDFWPSGGFSNVFDLPKYQAAAIRTYYKYHDPGYNSSTYNATQKARGFPDIALMSQNFITGLDGDFWAFTGTSASSPLLGAIITLINGERLKAGKNTVGFINPVLYEHPEIFNDVTEGSIGGCNTPGFKAVKGWDPASGLGTTTYPRLKKLFMSLP